MQAIEIRDGTRVKEMVFDHNQHFDTFSATIQHFEFYSALSIDRQCCCCGRTETIQRVLAFNAERLHEKAVQSTHELNSGSIMNFLRYRRRSATLCSVFNLADSLGLVLTRPLFLSAMTDPRHPFWRYPGMKRLTPERFMACCQILDRYGALYAINDGCYVSMARGV
jgi:hypothetical protein